MKIICNQQELVNGINLVTKAISLKSTLPILSGIYIETLDDQIKLIGNDLNFSIETTIPAEIKEQGKIVIPARLFSEFIKKLPNDDIVIETDEQKLIKINCQSSKIDLVGLPGEEYPELPEIENETKITLDKQLFCHMIKQTNFAISQDEARAILTGSLIEIDQNKFSIVSLDGFRMALKKANIINDTKHKSVVPGKILNEISKIISGIETTEDLKISFTENHSLFMIDNIKIYARLLSGEFINYNQILPEDFKTTLKVNTIQLKNALERAYLMARENSNVAIKIVIEDYQMSIYSDSEMGHSVENVPITLDGPDLTIGFNPRYILEAIKVIDSEEVQIRLNNNVSPCIIVPEDTDNYTYLLLPCRI